MADPTTPTESPTATPKSSAIALLATIAEQIKGSDQSVKDKVIEARVRVEVEKRASALEKALITRAAAADEIKKLSKPTQKVVDASGVVLHEGFLPAEVKAMEKARQRLGKIDKCINLALNSSEWGKLNEVK